MKYGNHHSSHLFEKSIVLIHGFTDIMSDFVRHIQQHLLLCSCVSLPFCLLDIEDLLCECRAMVHDLSENKLCFSQPGVLWAYQFDFSLNKHIFNEDNTFSKVF